MRVTIYSPLELIDALMSWTVLRSLVTVRLQPGTYTFVWSPNPYGSIGEPWYVLKDDPYIGLPCTELERRQRYDPACQLRVEVHIDHLLVDHQLR